jgi:hypothetical protein
MLVKVLVNLGADAPHPFRADEVRDVPDDECAFLLKRHWAIVMPNEPIALEPVVESPATPDKFQEMRQPRKRSAKPN